MKLLTSLTIVALTCAFCSVSAATAAPAATAETQQACGGRLETWFPPEGNGYAGGASYVIEFSNIGEAACSVRGYPTVALVNGSRRVGKLSEHMAGVTVRTIVLRPGQTAHVVLMITDPGAVCRPVTTNGLSVKLPGSPERTFYFAGGACPGRSTLRVDAISRGVGIPYYTIR